MDKKELLELIKTGEGYTIELKENLSNSIGKEICAFANASGGKIILGVKDDGVELVNCYASLKAEESKIKKDMEEMKKDSKITIAKLSEIIGINPSVVQKHIQKLKEKGIIKRIGPAKGGHWEKPAKSERTELNKDKVPRKVTRKVTRNQRKIISAMLENPYITIKDLAEMVSISDRKIKDNIRKLKAKGLLKRIGPKKGGHWEVVENKA